MQNTIKYKGYKIFTDPKYHNMIAVEKNNCRVHSPSVINAKKVIDSFKKSFKKKYDKD